MAVFYGHASVGDPLTLLTPLTVALAIVPRRLADTGQGANRIQAAPSLSKAMHAILARCQQQIGSWVGSSVVHMGDHNVPNAFMFIDKYTQVGAAGLGLGLGLRAC